MEQSHGLSVVGPYLVMSPMYSNWSPVVPTYVFSAKSVFATDFSVSVAKWVDVRNRNKKVEFKKVIHWICGASHDTENPCTVCPRDHPQVL